MPQTGEHLREREVLDRRLGAMRAERSDFIPHYKDLSSFIAPRRGRFLTDDVNKGAKKYGSIINGHATQALRTATAGMFAGTMNPARPWFQYGSPDPAMMEFGPVKVWLEKQEKLIRAIFLSGNLYSQAPTYLRELLLFGTGLMTHVEDFDDVSRFSTHTAGSYMIAQDDRLEVSTMVREFKRTVTQLIKQFSLKAVTQEVRDAYDRGNYDTLFDVVHWIEPNELPDFDSPWSTDKPFRSIYYQPGDRDRDKFLGKSGFDEKPFYGSRWEVTGEDIYGTDCPGMVALGDVKGLQMEERRKAQAIDLNVNPVKQGPAALKTVPLTSMPGGNVFFDSAGGQKIEPVHVPSIGIQDLSEDMRNVEQRIDKAFFVDLFNAITEMEGIQPRNERELLQRNEERLLQLGPVLERVHGEFLSQMVRRQFRMNVRAGIVSPPPEELMDKNTGGLVDLDIKFISSLAMAQQSVAVGSIERLANFSGGLAEVWPKATMKFDALQAVDEFATAIGAPAKLVVPDDVVQEQIAAAEAKAEQAQQMEQMAQMSQALGAPGTQIATDDLSKDSILSRSANLAGQQGPQGSGAP